jgi:hypothetical protein
MANNGMATLGGDLIFTIFNSTSGNYDLWRSDGTPAGTAMLPASGACGRPAFVVGAINGGVLYTTWGDGFGHWPLCRTDGTTAGTYELGEIAWPYAAKGIVLDGRVYFLTSHTLVSTNGIPGGTRQEFDFAAMGAGPDYTPNELAVIRGTLFFRRGHETLGPGLWASSGAYTERLGGMGTQPGADPFQAPVIETPNGLVALGSNRPFGAEPMLVPFRTVPDPLTFAPKSDVLTNSRVASAATQVTGTNVAVPVSAAGGEFCVSSGNACTCDVAPYSANGKAGIGQYLCVRHNSAATALTSVTTTLSVGGVASSFTSTTGSLNPATLYFDSGRASVAEAAGAVTLNVLRAGSLDEAVSVDFQAIDLSALAGVDYGLAGQPAPTGTLSWAAGDGTPKAFTIPIIADALAEPTESFRVDLANPTGGAVVGTEWPYKFVDISDGGAILSFRDASIEVREDGPNREVVVVRGGVLSVPATVSFRTVNGTAIAGTDFGAPSNPAAVTGILAFAANELERRITIGPAANDGPYIPLVNDTILEPAKSFNVELFNPGIATVISDAGRATQVVISSDEAGILFESSTYAVSEGAHVVRVGVSRSGRPPNLPAASVSYATANASALAGQHYTATTGRLNWAAGEAGTKYIDIPIIDNAVLNADRSFTVKLSSPANATLGTPAVASVNILDDDGSVQFTRSTASVTEGAPTISLAVNRTGGDGGAGASVNWTIVPGSAIANVDFTGTSGVLTWAHGDMSSRTISIPILNDNVPEPTKTFDVQLQNPLGVSLGTPSRVTVTLLDDDAGVGFAAPDYVVPEAAGSVILGVQRYGPASAAASVKWATTNGSAVAGEDFGGMGSPTQRSGTLSWMAGDVMPKNIVIPILQDSAHEGAQAFTVALSSPSAGIALGAYPVATVTITDDDIAAQSQISFSQQKYLMMEDSGNAVLTVRREPIGGGFTVPATVSYATQPGTALATSDYMSRSGTLTWAASDGANKTITIPIVNDTVAEPPESFKVTLSTGSPGAQVMTPDATVTIIDDDDAFPKFGAVPNDWMVPPGANAGWHATSEPGAFEGVYSLRSDAIDDGETAQVEVSRAFAAGNITFRVKVSSEPSFDKLRFFVDGVEKGSWSGTAVAGWTLFTTPITAGSHTLRWSYEKDGSASVGSDAAWIDAVTLP